MKLLEYEAKSILSSYNIPVPDSTLIYNSVANVSVPIVLKSQVPVGGRGKLGGIKVVDSDDDLRTTINSLFKLDIKGYMPTAILAEEKLTIKHEYYLSLIIDRPSAEIHLLANINGGIEVEESSASGFWNMAVSKDNVGAVGQQLADYYNLPGQMFVLQDLVKNLYKCFVDNDATLLEINPLILTVDNRLISGDCKMILDDSASFRHSWNFEDKPAETNFVTLDDTGNIATIANGAGLAMATVDAVAAVGMKPANFLDIGGGANTASLTSAFERIVKYPDIKAIIINIFAGITKCDEVALAIIKADKNINNLPPLYIRLAGTNYEAAAKLLSDANIPILPTVEACLAAAKDEAMS